MSKRFGVMKPLLTILSVLLAISLVANAGSNEKASKPALRLVLSEIQPGALSSEQYCMLVFDDHNFHAEKAYRTHGKDQDRKVYQGTLSDTDWNALTAILDGKAFRELNVPRSTDNLVGEDLHPYAISVARQKGFQNMEFLTKKSLKPYQSQVKPLLDWWKSARSQRMPESNSGADSRCSLNNRDALFTN